MRIELSAIFHGEEATYRDVDITLRDGMSRDEIIYELADELRGWLDEYMTKQEQQQ